MRTFSIKSSTIAIFSSGVLFGIASVGAATILGSDVFDDVPRGSYFDAAVGEMYSIGVIKGYDSNTFAPNDYVTRGQVAVMMKRLRDELKGITPAPENSSSAQPAASSSAQPTTTSSTQTTTRSSSSRSSSKSSGSSASYNPKGYFRFTTTAFTVSETTSSLTISIVRTGGADGSATLKYEAAAGTATAGTDFEVVSGTLTFANNETNKSFTITIKDDTTSEGSETIKLTLSNPTGASLGTPSEATLSIIDNESSGSVSSGASGGSKSSANPNGTVGFNATSYLVKESAGTLTVTVSRAGGTTGSVNVTYATSNGSGINAKEYTQATGTLTFAAGESSKTFTVPIIDDVSIDGNKTFNVTLSGPTGGANLGTSSAVVTIFDDDADVDFGSGAIKFSKATYDVTESSGKVEITVQRTGGAAGTVTVDYSTTSGTAASNDYTPSSGTLTFAPNESSKLISIPVVKDSTSDSGDTFFVNLSNVSPSTATLISPYSATVNIYD